MAFSLRFLSLLCVICGLLTGGSSFILFHKQINNCPPHWSQFNCNCYIYLDEGRTFDDAQEVCTILGGNLVSIQNDLENVFVQELAIAGGNTDVVWIGLSDTATPDTYEWTDGSDNTFLNFDTTNSEPDSSTGDCVVLDEDDGLWATASCTDVEPYICIRPTHE
ncbi:snaclec bothroinsularin subunit beta-like [Syngnathus acus]|uniref:snaclec bothroinsularin subunit beta-like n=1 Tax=Syngnathus acus TaxID=161584 RepID=UPI0018863831|nr:snaclec bothroinsularin subunit beta-like [Syngnathus acus]